MNPYIYILIMVITIFLIRVLPLTLIRKQITNRFLKSFLYYVPYVTLAVMTFPAIIDATNSPLAGALALVIGVLLAYFGVNMFNVSVICCVTVFISEFVLQKLSVSL